LADILNLAAILVKSFFADSAFFFELIPNSAKLAPKVFKAGKVKMQKLKR